MKSSLTIRIDDDLRELAEKYGKENGDMSLSAVVRQILSESERLKNLKGGQQCQTC